MRLSYASLLAAAAVVASVACSRLDVQTPVDEPNTGLVKGPSSPTIAPTSTNTVDLPPPLDVAVDTTGRPGWLDTRIQTLLAKKKLNPAAQLFRYQYKGQTVYYETISGADQFSTVYDSTGATLCHPEGGLTGKGDGGCPDFVKRRSKGVLVWTDPR